MQKPCHDTSGKLYSEAQSVWRKLQEVSKPYEDEYHKLMKLYEEVFTSETLEAIQSGYINDDEKRIIDGIECAYDGYGDKPDGLRNSSKYSKYLCAFCPFFDLGCGPHYPGCTFKPYEQRFHACLSIESNVPITLIKEYIEKTWKAKGRCRFEA